MNKARRNRIEKVINTLSEMKDEVDSIYEEEQEAYDNLPDSLQYSERGENMQNAIDNLDYASSSLDEAIDYLMEAEE